MDFDVNVNLHGFIDCDKCSIDELLNCLETLINENAGIDIEIRRLSNA